MSSQSSIHRLRDGTSITIEPVGPRDEDEVAKLLRALPERDLLFVRVDVTDDGVIHRWLDPQAGERETIGAVARREGKILGFTLLQRPWVSWMRHVGSILVVALPEARGLGLGTMLVRQTVLLADAAGVEKIVARMVVEDRDTVRVFEKLGFRHEGLLIDHAKASDGTLYDIAYMGLAVRRFRDAIEAGGNNVDLTRRPRAVNEAAR
ncbi:MAG: GNAT family N-acetyltransferase [Candidatus Eremiobacteraeota bacterium]|nr:GNAT family N-acetyltransferase [Candidatus Eremiobacteraeota bacterium]